MFSFCQQVKNNSKGVSNTEINDYVETENGDSILYFKDFDLYHFRGVGKIFANSLSYPYVRMVYRSDTLKMTAFYNKEKQNEVLFNQIQGKWGVYSYRWLDGDTNHFYKIFVDTAIIGLQFIKKPTDSLSNSHLLYLSVHSKNDNKVSGRVYKFYANKMSSMPILEDFEELKFKEKCDYFYQSDDEIEVDSIINTYTSFERVYDNQRSEQGSSRLVPDGYRRVSSRQLKYSSIFYNDFESMRSGDINPSIQDKIKGIKKLIKSYEK